MFQTSVNLTPVKSAVGVEILGGEKQARPKFEKGGRKYRGGGKFKQVILSNVSSLKEKFLHKRGLL